MKPLLVLVLALVSVAVSPASATYTLSSNFTGRTASGPRYGGLTRILDCPFTHCTLPVRVVLTLLCCGPGPSFFDNFWFFTWNDPTNGYVDYVGQQDVTLLSFLPRSLGSNVRLYGRVQATNWGLINATTERVYIGCDSWSVASGRGRASVRIQSYATYNTGLFVLDLDHMPTGCATWPAWWLCGPNWPAGGEIDIIEGVNTMTQDHTTLHTTEGCDMSEETGREFTGSWGTGVNGQNATDCWVNAPNQVCVAPSEHQCCMRVVLLSRSLVLLLTHV